MKTLNSSTRRTIACCLVMLLAAPFGNAVSASQQASNAPAAQGATEAAPQSTRPASAPQPTGTTAPGAPAAAQNRAQSDSSSLPQDAQHQQPSGASHPVGTAAAPYEQSVGASASRPAGAVIAPAKQRRARVILIRVALIVGAGVALGTVMALSHATPARPK